MKAKTILKSLFISGLVLFMTTAQAQPCDHGKKNKMDFIPELTDQQKEQISDKRTAHLKNVQSIKSDLDIKRAEKRKLMLQDDADKKAIDKKIDEISNLNAQLQKERADFHLSVKNILTDEQKTAWANHSNHRSGKMANHSNHCKGKMSNHSHHRRSKMSGCDKHNKDKSRNKGRGM